MNLIDRRTYRGKHPVMVGAFVNDRTILHIDSKTGAIRYDGPAVLLSRRYPVVSGAAFREWASHDVTEQLPGGEYMTWEQYLVNLENEKLGIG